MIRKCFCTSFASELTLVTQYSMVGTLFCGMMADIMGPFITAIGRQILSSCDISTFLGKRAIFCHIESRHSHWSYLECLTCNLCRDLALQLLDCFHLSCLFGFF